MGTVTPVRRNRVMLPGVVAKTPDHHAEDRSTMYRQFTPSAPMTKALSLPFSVAVGVLLTALAWYSFGLVGVVAGWMLLVIPGLAYLLGLPLAFACARLECALRRRPAPEPAASPALGSNVGP